MCYICLNIFVCLLECVCLCFGVRIRLRPFACMSLCTSVNVSVCLFECLLVCVCVGVFRVCVCVHIRVYSCKCVISLSLSSWDEQDVCVSFFLLLFGEGERGRVIGRPVVVADPV